MNISFIQPGNLFIFVERKMRAMRLIALFLLLPLMMFAQKEVDILPYIAQYKDLAVREMQQYRIPASITLAQGIHESNAGTSELARNARNHFGIKCKAEWTGGKYYYDDDAKGECFRVYDEAEKSYVDHSLFLSTRDRYKSLFSLSPTDYSGWAHGLKAAGYATNPKYASILISIIERYQLYQLDTGTYTFTPPTTQPAAPAKPQPAAPVYSREPTEFHNIRMITARDNEDPEAIAREFHSEPELIRAYNDLLPGQAFRRGEPIYLQPKWPTGSQESHKVQADETLWMIAQRFGIRLKSLCYLNNLETGTPLQPGQLLSLKKKVEKKTTAPVVAVSKEAAVYSVKPKDTLYSISRSQGVSIDDIRRWNNLNGDALQPGQQLKVSE